ncbi:hypothetical protein CARUB_v10024459mg [Capsella rubella]|uniref:PB1-like domain-containing protein n=1 Tax=Capsella rubella TaxID=81985 RepID=R0HSC2_9BRAS|nr:hypothetical protein CARUB_v10024459mg [Capsella rubella]
MSGFEYLKLNIHYGGDTLIKDDVFDYVRGSLKKDMLMDPDLMIWSIFEDFCKKNGVSGEVEQVWYKLPHEDK